MEQTDDRYDLKRKRSGEVDTLSMAPPTKSSRASHLVINYLARSSDQDVSLASNTDTLPTLLSTFDEYQGILERHESFALNLGAKPLGPILMKRFENLFDSPPKILHRSPSVKSDTTVSWLDVVEFARTKPEQFSLSQWHEGLPVCQFYTKQCRVQISEEDYRVIASGRLQQIIPSQPYLDDEENELGTIEILELDMRNIVRLADRGKSCMD